MKCKLGGEAISARDNQGMAENTIITRVLASVQQLDAQTWNALLASQSTPTPFMRHEYLAAMEQSGSAAPDTGWIARVITLWDGEELLAACPLYMKSHSYGEYVFDWAWARAYQQHGLPYYPKGLLAVPFTPVPGSRLLARTQALREALVHAVQLWATEQQLSSLHLLFGDANDLAACAAAGWMRRSTVQFHWTNTPRALPAAGACPPAGEAPTSEQTCDDAAATRSRWKDFDDFLGSLNQEKRKKIRQERRKVREAGVRFTALQGRDIRAPDWSFFYRCYERTYLEHGNPPYLPPEFFAGMAAAMPENWVMFIAERNGQPIASSLIAVTAFRSAISASDPLSFDDRQAQAAINDKVAYGRYWGALERVDSLHFEACYYQPIEWCIASGFDRFEGGAQGEHKMARALLPVETPSAHWVAHPAFADAIERFLQREGEGMAQYVQELQSHSPLRRA
ncbi:MAG: GNAT family N-acetyltransferase [Comamonas sp.]|uniref:GNAT family N-acetyltransferase n=1 Tax=Comamonas sp. TaxID=34028 RepID=UPI00284F4609|nr:GNAT family N-acetyltransferase [Comamonas sp.]MDR3066330.1 GNAT family N-acetyltransferase [Comamonas sp.]